MSKEAELKLSVDIEKAKLNKHYQKPIHKEDILFADFYKDVWLEPYKAGQQINLQLLLQFSRPRICFDFISYHFLANIQLATSMIISS